MCVTKRRARAPCTASDKRVFQVKDMSLIVRAKLFSFVAKSGILKRGQGSIHEAVLVHNQTPPNMTGLTPLIFSLNTQLKA